MSAEHSVEEVRELSKYLADGTPNWFRESFGDYKSSVHTLDNAPKNAVAMLTAYAKRIEADERAVPPRVDLDVIGQAIEERDSAMQACDDLAQRMVYKGNSVSWWHSKATAYRTAVEECWKALGELGIRADGKTHVADVIRTLTAPTHPPAQAAQIPELRIGAPAWPGQREGKAPPEGWVQLSVNNLADLATHSPDAADSVRVTDEMARALCAKFDELGYGYPDTDDAKLAITTALAAQGQGDAVAEVVAQDPATHGRPRAIRQLTAVKSEADLLPPGTKLYLGPPASPAGVPDGMVPVAELRHLYRAYVRTLEAGMERITSLGGRCDALDHMERTDPALIVARRVIAEAAAPSATPERGGVV